MATWAAWSAFKVHQKFRFDYMAFWPLLSFRKPAKKQTLQPAHSGQ